MANVDNASGKVLQKVPDLPFLKDYPAVGTFLRLAIAIAASATAALASNYLVAHGWNVAWLGESMIELFIAGFVILVTLIWSLVVKKATLPAMVEKTLEALENKQVSDQLKSMLPPATVAKLQAKIDSVQ